MSLQDSQESREPTENEKEIVKEYFVNIMVPPTKSVEPVSEIDDQSLVGDSRDESAGHEAMVIVVSTAISIALELIPGMDIIQMAGMVIDLVNPYDYLNSLSRSGLDEMSQNFINIVSAKLKEKEADIVNESWATLKNNPKSKLTKEDVEKMVKAQIQYWYPLSNPQVQAECYGDLESKGELAGKPKDGCNAIYREQYRQYAEDPKNIGEYTYGIYTASNVIFTSIINTNLNTYKSNVYKVFWIGIAFIVILLFIFIVFMWFRGRKRS